jgi:hypothetical protein
VAGNVGNPNRPGPTIPVTPPPTVGQILVYNCSRCKAQVSETATSCPNCKAIFTNRVQGGWNDRANRGNQPTPTQVTRASAPATNLSRDAKKTDGDGLSVPVILAIGFAGLLLLGGIAAAIILSQQRTSRPRRKRVKVKQEDYFYR